MPRIGYVCPGATSSAFAPLPAYDGRGAGPWQVSGAITGQPGTMGVPAGLGDFGDAGMTVNGVSVRGGGAGYSQGSGTMRAKAWYPSLYWESRLTGSTLTVPGQGVSIYSDNQMPIPAADPTGRAAIMAAAPRFLGQAQVSQPRGRGPKWPSWLPGRGYGG